MESIDSLTNFVTNWRSNHTYTTRADGSLSESSLFDLLTGINEKISKMDFTPPEGRTKAFMYSNHVFEANGKRYYSGDWVSEAVKSDGSSFSVNELKAGGLFDDPDFNIALSKATGDKDLASRLMSGAKTIDPKTGKLISRNPYSVDLGNGRHSLSIIDCVSQLFAKISASGDVTLIVPNADKNGVFYQTELFALLHNKKVTSINGRPIAEFKAIYKSSGLSGAFDYVKAQSKKMLEGSVKLNSDGSFSANVDAFVEKPTDYWLNKIEQRVHRNGKPLLKWVEGLDDIRLNSKQLEAYIKKLKIPKYEAEQLMRTAKAVESITSGKAGSIMTSINEVGIRNMALYTTYRSNIMKVLGPAGIVLLASDVINTVKRAGIAYGSGNYRAGHRIMSNWVFRNAFGTGSAMLMSKAALPLVLLTVASFSSVWFAVPAGIALDTILGFLGYSIGSFIGDELDGIIWSLLNQASTIPVRIDPIVLDLSGLGITTKSVADGVYYDMDNNGFLEKTGWVDAKSGILVLDKNGDGKIETGNELFGDRTILADGKTASSGFEALATLDSNHDGVIDAKDKLFSQLRIWVDKNGDGVSDKGELITLAQAGIKSLSLKHKELNQLDANGNTIARVGSFTRTNGKVAEMKEYLLARSTSDVKMVNSVKIPDDIMELPEIRPIGNTYSLRQAMAKDKSGKLKQLVLSFTGEKNVAKRRAILEDILFTWTGVAKVDPASRGGLIDARRLAALEIVTGTNYRNSPISSPTSQEAPILEQAYGNLAESIYNMLSLQDGTMDGILRKFTYHIDLSSDGNPIKLDIASVKAYLDGQLKQNRQEGERLLGEVTRILKNRGLVTEKEFSSLRDYYARKSAYYQKIIDTTPFTTARGTAKDDVMSGAVDRDNIIAGNYGDDTIYGSNGVNILYGEAGNDSLYGGSNIDTLIGGKGNDYLQGGYGNDTYIFSKGDGKDTIYDEDSTKGNLDTIRFGAGIKPADLIFIHPVCPPNVSYNDPGYVDENDLIIRFKNSPDDQITVKNYFRNYYGIDQPNDYAIERIEFTDSKAVLTAKDIITQARIRHGTAKDDHIGGLADNGNDTLIGGKGNDYLNGGYGNDTYIFSKGDGKDTIYDEDSTKGNLDTIRFGAGIKPADLIFKYVNNNLQISQHGSTDSVTVNSWQYGKPYQIENVRTANGSMITNTQVDKLIQAMATFQHDTGMSWEQALKSQPSKVQTILQDYWTIPSA